MIRTFWRLAAVLFCLTLVAAACGDSATTTIPPVTTQPATTTATTTTPATTSGSTTMAPTTTMGATTTAAPPAITGSIVIAETASTSYSRLPAAAVRDRLNAAGWDIETVNFASTDLSAEAVASGQADMARFQGLEGLQLIQLGANVINLASDRPDEFVVVTPVEIDDCAQLADEPTAVHSEGSTYTHIFNFWLSSRCGIEDKTHLVISGGDNRVIAMIQGQVTGSPVQMADFINLDAEAPGEYHILANFGREIDGLLGGVLMVNKDWLAENRDLAVAYLTELFRELRAANVDGSTIREAAEQYQSEADAAIFDTVRDVYLRDLGGFPECGVFTEQIAADMLALFETVGTLDPGLTPDDIVDFSALEEARAAAGHC